MDLSSKESLKMQEVVLASMQYGNHVTPNTYTSGSGQPWLASLLAEEIHFRLLRDGTPSDGKPQARPQCHKPVR